MVKFSALNRRAGALELAIDVAGEDAVTLGHALAPAFEDREAGVRFGVPVQLQAMAVETPGQRRIGVEGVRRGDLGERHARAGEGGVGLPESLVAAKIGQARVDAHAGAGGDEQQVGIGDQGGGLFEQVGGEIRTWRLSYPCRRTGRKSVQLRAKQT